MRPTRRCTPIVADIDMVPPVDRVTTVQTKPTRWHVSDEDAMVIALAELNRHEHHALYCPRPPLAPLGNPQRLWRNADTASAYFSEASSTGSGPSLVWHLTFDHADATYGKRLLYTFEVHGNGTILSAKRNRNQSVLVTQFHRPLPQPPQLGRA